MLEGSFLRRGSAAKREERDAIEQVGELHRAGNIDGLATMMRESSQPLVRRRAMESLLAMGRPEGLELLAEVAAGPEMGLNEEILFRLRDLPGDAPLRAIAVVLSSENALRRASAVSIFACRKEPLALTMLLRGARDPARAVCRIAERSLISRVASDPAQLGELPRESVAGIISFVPFEVGRDLVGPGFPPAVREEAARRIGKSGGGDAVTTLMALTTDADPSLARAAWEGLRAAGEIPATLLLPFLGDRNEEVRRQGVELFARSCGKDGLSIVAAALSDRAPGVRCVAIRALARAQGEAAHGRIRKLAEDPDENVRRAVLQALTGFPEATEDLVAMTLRETGPLQESALMAVAARGVYRSELGGHCLEFLQKHAAAPSQSSEVVDAMASLAKILGDANETRAIAGFAALCKSTSRRLRRTGIEAILAFPPEARGDVLVELADTYDRSMLSVIALALADMKHPGAVVPLIRTYSECGGRASRRAHDLLQDHTERLADITFLLDLLFLRWPSVRKYAAECLKRSDDLRVVEPLLRASEDEDVEVQLAAIEALAAYAKKDERVAARLMDACALGDITVRQAAVEALGDAQIQEAVPAIIKALHNIFLRPRASEALKKIGGRQGYLAMKRLQRREQLFGKRSRRHPTRRRIAD